MCLNLYLIYNIYNIIKENCNSNETEWWNNWLILMLVYDITFFPSLYTFGAFFIVQMLYL